MNGSGSWKEVVEGNSYAKSEGEKRSIRNNVKDNCTPQQRLAAVNELPVNNKLASMHNNFFGSEFKAKIQ